MGWLVSQQTVVGLAILGGLASLLAMVLGMRGRTRRAVLDRLNRIAYILMGASIVLFVVTRVSAP
jgi:hypothetical protein